MDLEKYLLMLAWYESKRRTYPVKDYMFNSYCVPEQKSTGQKNHSFPKLNFKLTKTIKFV